MTTEDDVRALLAGINERPDNWRARCLILADACRELGRDLVATAIFVVVREPYFCPPNNAVLSEWIAVTIRSRVGRADRRWIKRIFGYI